MFQKCTYGSMANDGGHLLMSENEKIELVNTRTKCFKSN